MWFASLFSNEALISISTVQLLHFSQILPAQAQAEDCQQEKSAWREKSGQPNDPTGFPSQALPKVGRGSSDGNIARAPGGCADSMLQVVSA